MAIWTTNGLNLIATAVQTTGVDVAIKYVGLSTGCGALGAQLTVGVNYTSLPLAGTLPANLAGGQSLLSSVPPIGSMSLRFNDAPIADMPNR